MELGVYFHQEAVQPLPLHVDHALGIWNPRICCPHGPKSATRAVSPFTWSCLLRTVYPPPGVHVSRPNLWSRSDWGVWKSLEG